MIKINGICYIVGASFDAITNINLNKKENDLIVAADGGYDILKKNNISADILLGDLDSVKKVAEDIETIKFPVKKDETDTFLACNAGFDRGYKTFVILGGTGGRFDHTLANIQTLCSMAKRGGTCYLVGDGWILTAIHNSSISFTSDHKGNIGVFAHGATAENVNINGLEYSAEGLCISPDFPIGVSNSFKGEKAYISVETGTLLVVWQEKQDEFLKHIAE